MYYLQNKNLKIQFLQELKQEPNEILITRAPKIYLQRKNPYISFSTFCGKLTQIITPRSLLGVIYEDLAIFFSDLRQTGSIKA